MPYIVDAHREPPSRNLTLKEFFELFERQYGKALADSNLKNREVRAITGFGSHSENGNAQGGKIHDALNGCLARNKNNGRLDFTDCALFGNPGEFVIYPKEPLLPRDAPPVLDDASKDGLKDQIVQYVGAEGKSIADIRRHFKSSSVTGKIIDQCVNALCQNTKRQRSRLRREGDKLKQN